MNAPEAMSIIGEPPSTGHVWIPKWYQKLAKMIGSNAAVFGVLQEEVQYSYHGHLTNDQVKRIWEVINGNSHD